MGYENREYFRDDSNTRGGGGTFMAEAPMCKKILIVTVVIFIAQLFFTRPAKVADVQHQIDQMQAELREEQALYGEEIFFDEEGEPIQSYNRELDPKFIASTARPVSIVQEWLKLDTEKVIKKGQIWRLITSAFCHDRFGVYHIVFNMLFLYWFGRFVESTYGSKEFLCFYLVAALVVSVAFIGLELFTGDRHGAIGASGAVMAVVCVFAMWNPDHRVNVYFLFPIPIRLLLLLYVIFDLHPVLLALSGTIMYSGVAHAAHLGGLLFGYLFYRNNWRLLPYWNRIAAFFQRLGLGGGVAKRPNLRVHSGAGETFEREPQEVQGKTKADARFDDQLDDVLRKISESGQDSLSEGEKKILMLGSKRYRNQ